MMPLSSDGSELLNWRKAKGSMNNGNCTEVATAAAVVIVRDSQDPSGPVLRYPATSWRSFLSSARQGGFDIQR
jgi:hypothetical protein